MIQNFLRYCLVYLYSIAINFLLFLNNCHYILSYNWLDLCCILRYILAYCLFCLCNQYINCFCCLFFGATFVFAPTFTVIFTSTYAQLLSHILDFNIAVLNLIRPLVLKVPRAPPFISNQLFLFRWSISHIL